MISRRTRSGLLTLVAIVAGLRATAAAADTTLGAECEAGVKRELNKYFRGEFRAKKVAVDITSVIGSAITGSTDIPRFYLWVRASTLDAKSYQTGAVRVVTEENSSCSATGFIRKTEILAHRDRLETWFPMELIPKILSLAETPQK